MEWNAAPPCPESALGRILDMIAEDLLETSDKELVQEMREDGLDPEKELRRAKERGERALEGALARISGSRPS